MLEYIEYIVNLDFYKYFEDNDYINLLCVNKSLYKKLDKYIYYNLLIKNYNENFINTISVISISWKECYNKMKKIEHLSLNYSIDIWYDNEYLEFWKNRMLK